MAQASVVCLAADPDQAHSGVVLAGSSGGGILRTTNRTPLERLQFRPFQLRRAVHGLAPIQPAGSGRRPGRFAGTEGGVYRSPNGGRGWKQSAGLNAPSFRWPWRPIFMMAARCWLVRRVRSLALGGWRLHLCCRARRAGGGQRAGGLGWRLAAQRRRRHLALRRRRDLVTAGRHRAGLYVASTPDGLPGGMDGVFWGLTSVELKESHAWLTCRFPPAHRISHQHPDHLPPVFSRGAAQAGAGRREWLYRVGGRPGRAPSRPPISPRRRIGAAIFR